jgi:hypothetical protein
VLYCIAAIRPCSLSATIISLIRASRAHVEQIRHKNKCRERLSDAGASYSCNDLHHLTGRRTGINQVAKKIAARSGDGLMVR